MTIDNRQRILDWKPRYDERSRRYRSVAGIETRPMRSYSWSCQAWLDQGREGACVGFGWSHELCARPKVHMVDEAFATDVYNKAKQIDEWPGEEYDGTSVLAGALVIYNTLNSQGQRLIGGYSWAFSVEELVRTIAYKGPVVLGINWYENMYDPDENGYIWAEGPLAGGHCLLANGFRYRRLGGTGEYTYANMDKKLSRIRVHNSWGKGWGIDGEGFIDIENLEYLFNVEGGEGCLPVLRTI